ncbi:DsbA family oxidoreductase [Acetobacter sacchari]|uniref:DsbA family oxidoreductase n=1 Tax=Acetobacter sacchari TaxID=2661687 RepID=A0ABS3LUI6_9PROT|nr:DsbA family oxidoreductase [Acetobacter sacchari]MBO1359575.1 DsbA family oxidoreductase [Acetobacter sacchari]
MNMLTPVHAKVEVEIVFDFVCAWCYIGIEQLVSALEQRDDVDCSLRWRPFLLNPSLPVVGVSFADYLRSRHGSDERSARICGLIAVQAHEAGLDIRFERITRVRPTIDAHRLLAWAGARGDCLNLARAIFAAYFRDGADIADHMTLADLAAAEGFDRDIALQFLAGQTLTGTVIADHVAAQKSGINGVPSVVIGGLGLTGVHDARVFDKIFDAACPQRSMEQNAGSVFSHALLEWSEERSRGS